MPFHSRFRTRQTHQFAYQLHSSQRYHLSATIHRAMRRVGALRWGLRGRVLLPALAFLAACGGGPGGTSSATTDTTGSARAATPTPDARVAAIVDGYSASTRAFVHAMQTANPVDAGLAETMTGAQLQTVIGNISSNHTRGIVGQGDITVRDPHVVTVDGTSAVVEDCRWDTLRLVYVATGQPVSSPRVSGQDEGVRATLTLVAGTWKVSSSDVMTGSCPAGY
jgi:hypothetical protein